jgi:chromosome segregation ATPase
MLGAMLTNIFMRAENPMPTIADNTATAIARAVRKSNRLHLAEAELARLRHRRNELIEERRELISSNKGSLNSEITQLGSEISAIEATVSAARVTVAPLRAEHAEAVCDALAPMRAEAAGQFLQAIAAMKRTAQMLDQIAAEITRVGGRAEVFRLPFLAEVEQVARRLASRR